MDLSLPEDLGDEDLSNTEDPFASDAHSLKVASNANPATSCIFNTVLNIRTGRRTPRSSVSEGNSGSPHVVRGRTGGEPIREAIWSETVGMLIKLRYLFVLPL